MDAQSLLARRRRVTQDNSARAKLFHSLHAALEPLQPAKRGWLVTTASKKAWARDVCKFAKIADDAGILSRGIERLTAGQPPILEQEAAMVLEHARNKQVEQIVQYLLSLESQQEINDVHRATCAHAAAIANSLGDDEQPTMSATQLNPPQYVTLLQMASRVQRGKRTLRRMYDKGELPDPDVPSKKNGKPHEWLWETVRPILEKTFDRSLPIEYESLIPVSRR